MLVPAASWPRSRAPTRSTSAPISRDSLSAADPDLTLNRMNGSVPTNTPTATAMTVEANSVEFSITFPRYTKMSSGKNADTVTFGRSTMLLTFRSTATLHITYAWTPEYPRS